MSKNGTYHHLADGALSLGAEEILRANKGTLDYNGYEPTYRQLESYDHLIDKTDLRASPGSTVRYGQGGLKESLDVIRDYIKTYSPQVRKLAKHLATDIDGNKITDEKQIVFNTWHFFKTHIKYAFDEAGKEQLRTPARSWMDRFSGIDCDDYAIFGSCILRELNIHWQLKIVAFNYKTSFSHIYVVAGKNGLIVLDGVMNKFNEEPAGITKSFMEGLSGFGFRINPIISFALGSVENTSLVQQMRAKLTALERKNATGKLNTAEARDLRKMRVLLAMVGIEEDESAGILLQLMPHVKDVTNQGQLLWQDPVVQKLMVGDVAEEELTAAEKARVKPVMDIFLAAGQELELGQLDDGEDDDYLEQYLCGYDDYDSLGSLGKRSKEEKKAKRKQRREKIKTVFKKIGKVLKKIDPIMGVARGSYLAALRVNFLGQATKLKYLQVKKPDGWKAFLKKWDKLGGAEKRARKAIEAGHSKKPLFKKSKDLEKYKLAGLGAPPLAAAFAAAGSIIGAISGMLSKFLKKGEVPGAEDTVPANAAIENEIITQSKLDPNYQAAVNAGEPGTDDASNYVARQEGSSGGTGTTGDSNMMWWILGTIAAVGTGYVVLKPKTR